MKDFLTTSNASLLDVNSLDALPVGTYEVTIKNVEERVSISGNSGVSFQLEVRKGLNDEDDLVNTNGNYGGRVFFSNIWESEKNFEYRFKTLNTIAIAAGAKDHQVFESFDDFKEFLTGRPIRINLTHDVSMYRGEARVQEQVAPWDWEPTHVVMEEVA
jgi:hypothetical protein